MKDFERTIVCELLSVSGGNEIAFPEHAGEGKIEFSGAGYFVTLKDSSFPKNRVVLDKPDIRGQLGGVEVGYLAFIENHELTLECFSYEQEVTVENREQGFEHSKT